MWKKPLRTRHVITSSLASGGERTRSTCERDQDRLGPAFGREGFRIQDPLVAGSPIACILLDGKEIHAVRARLLPRSPREGFNYSDRPPDLRFLRPRVRPPSADPGRTSAWVPAPRPLVDDGSHRPERGPVCSRLAPYRRASRAADWRTTSKERVFAMVPHRLGHRLRPLRLTDDDGHRYRLVARAALGPPCRRPRSHHRVDLRARTARPARGRVPAPRWKRLDQPGLVVGWGSGSFDPGPRCRGDRLGEPRTVGDASPDAGQGRGTSVERPLSVRAPPDLWRSDGARRWINDCIRKRLRRGSRVRARRVARDKGEVGGESPPRTILGVLRIRLPDAALHPIMAWAAS
jgi:hypothetical protein